MTPLAIILFCMALIMVIGVVRKRPGSAVTDLVVLVGLFAIIAVVDILLARFWDMADAGWTLGALLAAAFALDAIYGLMAPHRQRERDRQLRDFLRRRRA